MTKQTLSLSVNKSCNKLVVVLAAKLPNSNWALVLCAWPSVGSVSIALAANIGMQPLSLATNDWVADWAALYVTPFVVAVAVKGVTIFCFFYIIINKVKFFGSKLS